MSIVHLSAADTVCELMNRLQCCMNCGAGPLQRKMQRQVTPALAVLVVVNAVDNECLHGGVVVGQVDTGYSGN